MSNKKALLILILAFAVLLGGAGVLYNVLGERVGSQQLAVQSQPEQPREEEAQPAGSESQEEEPVLAPDFTVYDGEGEAVMLSDFAGKPVVLNFWASWCGPCKSEMPHFQSAYTEYGEEVAFLMVNCTGGRETLESAKEYLEESGYTFPVYYDTDGLAAYLYGAYSIPMTFFIDDGGYVAAWGRGALDLETLERGLDMILPQ